MFGLSPIESVFGVLGWLVLGPRGFSRAKRDLNTLTGEIRAPFTQMAATLIGVPDLPAEVRAAVDGAGRPLRSWHVMPTTLPSARTFEDPTPRAELDPTV